MLKYCVLLLLFISILSCNEPDVLSFTESEVTPWLYTVDSTASITYSFYLYTPPQYENSVDEYPLLVHLHGWGNFGIDPDPSQFSQGALRPLYEESNNSIKEEGINDLNEHVRESFVIYPRLHHGYAGDEDTLSFWHPETLLLIIDYIRNTYPIDDNRLYITGLSYGGGGTWKFGLSQPELVAAIVPVSAAYPWGEESTDVMDLDLSPLRNIPIWDFCSFDDNNMGYPSSLVCRTFNKITGVKNIMSGYPNEDGVSTKPADGYYTLSMDVNGNGEWTAGVEYPSGSINYTLYNYGGHDAWTRTYENDTMWEWLYAQSK